MALIIDPDLLIDPTSIAIDTTAKTVQLLVADSLTTDGVTIKCVYSKLKELWSTSADYVKFPFPMGPITDEQFEMVNGWDWKDATTRNLLRTGGWAVKDSLGASTQEWAGIISLGAIDTADQAYYLKNSAGSTSNFVLTGPVNQAIKVFDIADGVATATRERTGYVVTLETATPHLLETGDYATITGLSGSGFNGTFQITYVNATTFTYTCLTTGNVGNVVDVGGLVVPDYRYYLKVYCRIYQKTYAFSQLSDIGVTSLTYQAYRFPLANAADVKVTHNDASMSGAPYSGMSITWYAAAQPITIGGVPYNFHVKIDGNSGTAEQIYEYVQYELRQATDIDAGAGTQIGKKTSALLKFVGDTLYTQEVTEGGVYIVNYLDADVNRLVLTYDGGSTVTYPYTAILTINFGDNLVNDAGSKYWIYFTNDDAGDNAGYDYGTANAIIVKDNANADMTGLISSTTPIVKTFAYDTNIQRGAASAGDDAPITAVAIGLSTAQFVKTTGTITRSTSNSVSLVAPLERNYQNPA
jgi:hypothetical protein